MTNKGFNNMYKPSKLQQKLFNHILKDHKGRNAEYVQKNGSDFCEICRKLHIEIQNDSQVNA